MREFDGSLEIELFAATAAGLLVFVLVTVDSFFSSGRYSGEFHPGERNDHECWCDVERRRPRAPTAAALSWPRRDFRDAGGVAGMGSHAQSARNPVGADRKASAAVQPAAGPGPNAWPLECRSGWRGLFVNVFASWCVACREEHPLFMQLKAGGVVPIHGLNYKDQPDNAARWLNTLGDPYTRTGADRDGRVAIDWGVYGVPETFVTYERRPHRSQAYRAAHTQGH